MAVAKAALDEKLLQRSAGFSLVGGDHDALAGGEAVELDHGRIAAHCLQTIVNAFDRFPAAGRHAGGLHHLFRISLRTFEPRGGRDRAEGRNPSSGQRVNKTAYKRRFRADDNQIQFTLAG